MSDPGPPPLQEAELDATGLGDLINDLEALAQIHEVRLKRGARSRADEPPVGLREAVELLHRGELAGFQVVYSHQGKRWIDTLMATKEGARLVRIEAPAG